MRSDFNVRAKHELKRIWHAWKNARVNVYGSATAYAVVFSLAPILIITLSVAGLLFDQGLVAQNIVSNFASTFGRGGGELAEELLKNGNHLAEGGVAAGISGLILIFIGATAIFSTLQHALDTIFESLPEKRIGGIWKTIVQKLVSVGIVLSVGFILLISLTLSAIIKAFSTHVQTRFIEAGTLAQVAELSISFLIISFFLALMIKFLPSRRLQWKPALAGGVVAGLLFTIGKYALGAYLGSSTAASVYGAASSLVLIIIWTYYMSLAFFLSAILTKLYFIRRK